MGARSIYLLGFDMGKTAGKSHFFGEHPKGMNNGNYQNFVNNFSQLAKDLEFEGVEVINFTRTTNLTQFKRATIDDHPGICSEFRQVRTG